MTEIKIPEWGGKRQNSGRKKRIEYRQFSKARLSDDLQDWLSREKGHYETWEKFFKEIKKRYEIL